MKRRLREEISTIIIKLILTNLLDVDDMDGDGLALFFRYKLSLKEGKHNIEMSLAMQPLLMEFLH